MNDQTELLNAIIGTLNAMRDDIEKIRQSVDIIHATQVSHGKALAELQLEVERHLWRSTHPTSTPIPAAVAK